MKKIKRDYFTICETAEMISKKHSLLITDQDKELKSKIENFALKIPLIGIFNAGKSTLLNKFLGEKVLKVNSEAETSVPCEIKFSTEERTLIHLKNGTTVEKEKTYNITIEESSKVNYIEKYVNNKILQEYPDLILVDMPGLDSSYKEHEQAIANYIEEGVYFILLSDVANGTIKNSMETFVDKITSFDEQFAILISKTDLLEKEEVDLVVNDIQEEMKDRKLNVFVGKISNSNIDDFYELLKRIYYEEIFEKIFKGQVLSLLKGKIKILSVILENQTLDVVELNEEIQKNEEKFKELEKNLNFEKQNFDENKIADKILSELNNYLKSQVKSLVRAAKSGEEKFNKKLKNMIDVKVRDSFQSIVQSKVDVMIDNLEEFELEVAPNIIKETIASLGFTFRRNIAQFILLFLSKYPIPVPPLEILVHGLEIFFNILKLSKKDEKIQEQILEIIEQVQGDLNPIIKEKVLEIKDCIFEKITEKYELEKQEIEVALESLKNDKEKTEEEFKSKILEIERDIEVLKNFEILKV